MTDGNLILTRRISEAIKIGDEIEVRVLGVRGEQVRLGVTAPKDTKIMRPEVLARGKPQDPKTDE